MGEEARRELDAARDTLARATSTDPKHIVFTSGGTEANNLAIKGVAHAATGKKRHLITTKCERRAGKEGVGAGRGVLELHSGFSPRTSGALTRLPHSVHEPS